MAASQVLSPQIVGRAENAHKPILDRILATNSRSKEEWVALTLLATGSAHADRFVLAAQITDALKIEEIDATNAISALVASDHVRELDAVAGRIELTESGRKSFEGIRSEVGVVVSRAYGDISEEDLVTAARVLTHITERLNREFEADDSRS